MKIYKDRQLVDGGSGSMNNITSVECKSTEQKTVFKFLYSYLSNFKGTVLHFDNEIDSVYVVISDREIPKSDLRTFGIDVCYEWVFQHVAVKALIQIFDRYALQRYKDGRRDFAADLRSFIGITIQ